MKTTLITSFITIFLTISVFAQDKPDEMDTDRPNITETPQTVKKGRVQYETDLLRRDRKNNELEKQKEWLYNQANLKFGLLKNTDLQFIVQTYGKRTSSEISTGKTESREGFGDLTFRIKQNLKGNENGNFAIALVPYLKFPTNNFSDNKKYEGGLIVPMKLKLPKEWELSFQVEADRLKDDTDEGMHSELLNSVNLNHNLIKKLKAFAESYYTFNFKEHEWNNFLDAALQYDIKEHVKIDAGFNYGLQKHAEKSVFIGAAFRL